jgi:chromosomal replication initiation ATPase DnaA
MSPFERRAYEAAKQKLIEESQKARRLGITINRLREIEAYTASLRKKHPHIKPDRLQKKVAEYFKIKLV